MRSLFESEQPEKLRLVSPFADAHNKRVTCKLQSKPLLEGKSIENATMDGSKVPQDFTNKQDNCSTSLPLIYNSSKKFLSSNHPLKQQLKCRVYPHKQQLITERIMTWSTCISCRKGKGEKKEISFFVVFSPSSYRIFWFSLSFILSLCCSKATSHKPKESCVL